jgi:sugar lactone lactonase YvrE
MATPIQPSPDPNKPLQGSSPSAGGLIVLAIIAIATAVGAYAVFQTDPWGRSSPSSEDRFALDLKSQMDIPADLLSHTESGRIDVARYAAKALTVDSKGRIFLAAQNSIQILSPDGVSLSKIETESTPSCLAVADQQHAEPGRVYAAVDRQIIVVDAQGKVTGTWEPLNDKAVITAIAITPQTVLVADAGNRCVVRYSTAGARLGEIGAEQPDRDMPGFIIPSPYFDLSVGSDETVSIVNPGMRRVETFTWEGQLQSVWGAAGSRLQDFFGCCNPSHVARLPDGRLVTSEKGIPRVKVYSAVGEFESVVAGPRQLQVSESALGDARVDQDDRVFDVAVDPNVRILVLDPRKKCIRVFEANDAT